MTLEQWAAENDDLVDFGVEREIDLPLWLTLESDWEATNSPDDQTRPLVFD